MEPGMTRKPVAPLCPLTNRACDGDGCAWSIRVSDRANVCAMALDASGRLPGAGLKALGETSEEPLKFEQGGRWRLDASR